MTATWPWRVTLTPRQATRSADRTRCSKKKPSSRRCSMPNSRRRSKRKLAKRGRIATPQHKMPMPMMGGGKLPMFQEGGTVATASPVTNDWTDPYAVLDGGGGDGGWGEGIQDYINTPPPMTWRDAAGRVWVQTPNGEWQLLSEGGPALAGGGLTQFEMDLMLRRQELDERETELQNQIAENQIAADQAIAAGNRRSVEKIEAQRRYMESLQLQYAQQRDTLDRYAEQQGVALGQRAQDVTQRGQTLEGRVAQAGAFGQLAGLEQQRQQNLQALAADPRDFMQLGFAMGGGQNFLNQLLEGRGVTGQSATAAGETPLLGAGFDRLMSQIGPTPMADYAAMTAARVGAGAPVGALGPEAVLSPDQQETFRLFRQAAPDVPVDIAINIARNPAAARAYLTAFGGGGGGAGVPAGGTRPTFPATSPGGINVTPGAPTGPVLGGGTVPTTGGGITAGPPGGGPGLPTAPPGAPTAGGGTIMPPSPDYTGQPYRTTAPGFPDMSSYYQYRPDQITLAQPWRQMEQMFAGTAPASGSAQGQYGQNLLQQLFSGTYQPTRASAQAAQGAGMQGLAQRIAHYTRPRSEEH